MFVLKCYILYHQFIKYYLPTIFRVKDFLSYLLQNVVDKHTD